MFHRKFLQSGTETFWHQVLIMTFLCICFAGPVVFLVLPVKIVWTTCSRWLSLRILSQPRIQTLTANLNPSGSTMTTQWDHSLGGFIFHQMGNYWWHLLAVLNKGRNSWTAHMCLLDRDSQSRWKSSKLNTHRNYALSNNFIHCAGLKQLTLVSGRAFWT